MKVAELKKKDAVELQKLLREKRETVRALNFQLESRQLKNVRSLRQAKKEVARIITIINEFARTKNE